MIRIVEQKTKIDILKMLKDTGAIMEGHFRLTSGFHSRYYLQCAKLLQYPDLTYKIVSELPDIIDEHILQETETVISPAIGGILFGYMLAFKLEKKMIFAERKTEKMEIRRGFEIKKGEKFIVAEDVITTGGSVGEIIDLCRANEAEVNAVVSMVDRSSDAGFDVPYYYLVKFDIDKYSPENCPLCKEGIKVNYPGSKKNI
ncbi:MAG: orotate phosphoribosyltransferase [Actinobacteria bacterium]|nr:orotate phosphoribosyltransferase [Actinomycetota bacterium]